MIPLPSKPSWPTWCARAMTVLALSAGVAAPAKAQPADDPGPAASERGVDVRIRPGDDFFAYANGDWLQRTEIPAGRTRWTAGNEITERTRQRIEQLLADARSAPPGSSARRVADFHDAYLDEARIERLGIAPLRPQFARIDRVRSKTALARLLGQGLPADVDPLQMGVYRSAHVLGLAVQPSTHAEQHPAAFVLQGGLGLPNRELYLDPGPRTQALRVRYQASIARQLAQAGFDRAEQRAAGVMALETALARSHATDAASADDRNADHRWTHADFARQAPGLDWAAFLAAAGLARQPIVVAWQPGAVQGLAAQVASTPLPVWKDYLRFHAIHALADVLPQAFAQEALALQRTLAEASAAPAPGTRAQRATAATQAALGSELGRLYVERHFPAAHKARVQAIANDVIAAFSRRVEAVTWMSAETRAQALAKLRTVYFGVGHPDRWPEDTGPAMDREDAAGNLRRVAEHRRRQALARLTQRVDPTAWFVPPQWPGAVLAFHLNAYNFAAALLQPPKFDPDASEAANYGAIGAIIGHELSHFVDTLGAEYDVQGRMRPWWTPADSDGYRASTAPLVSQFGGYRPFADLAVDGTLTLTENLADLGGLAAAFDAYRRTLGARAGDQHTLRQQDRQFFIGFARAWRAKSSEAATRQQMATDSHAPERYRVATVRNLDAWYDAFDVQPGQPLYLEPRARLRIW